MKVYEGIFSEKEYLRHSWVVLITKRGTFGIEGIFEKYVGSGRVYRVTIEEIKEEKENRSLPITAEREYVPA